MKNDLYKQMYVKYQEGLSLSQVDHDKTNNNIDNLVAMPKSVHAWLFSEGSNQHVKKTIGIEEMGIREHYLNQFIANKYWA